MEYVIKIFTIGKLIKMYKDKELDLNPPYQRNEIWSTKAKQSLIESIEDNLPIPNIFLYKSNTSNYEMVDGQQRARAIFGYYNKHFPNVNDIYYSSNNSKNFKKYRFVAIIITKIEPNESIEKFYALVNKTGLKLNRPELRKADYFNKRFLTLLEKIAISKELTSLDLFSESSLNRMNDIDLVGELVALLKFGATDKKFGVDKLFESDVTIAESKTLYEEFISILNVFDEFNDIYFFKNTRYRQRNDLYTLFNFCSKHSKIKQDTLNYFYKLLVLIDEDITPQNDACLSFKEYALHCVSQSNSKNARTQRLYFLESLLLNKSKKPNEIQKDIMNFYNFKNKTLFKIDKFYTINLEILQKTVVEPVVSL